MARGFQDRFKDFRDAASRAYGEGREDHTKAAYAARELQGLDTDAPRLQQTLSTNPTFTRANELLLNNADAQYVEARRRLGMGAETTMAGKLGQGVGTLAGDLTQDSTRSLWWLLNAAQATGNVINEAVLAKANPRLYGASKVPGKEGKPIRVMKDYRENQEALNAGLLDADTGKLKAGVGIKEEKEGDVTKRYYTKRNFEPGHVAALGIPTGIAINTGLGLMTPFGGAEGYKAAVPDEEDPTKTANVINEIGQKYFLGKTGKLLPYSEFSEVRPDVSPGEYKAYSAFKYDNNTDMNPFDDGQMVAPGGVLKVTDEGIHGPEVQFLGRSLPATTGLLPFATSLIGGAIGVKAKQGGRFGGPIRGGFGGGLAGLAVGQVAGQLLESERRRRNTVENQLDNPQS